MNKHTVDEAIGGYEADINKCPKCGGDADNGYDREYPPNPYYCTKCESDATVSVGGHIAR